MAGRVALAKQLILFSFVRGRDSWATRICLDTSPSQLLSESRQELVSLQTFWVAGSRTKYLFLTAKYRSNGVVLLHRSALKTTWLRSILTMSSCDSIRSLPSLRKCFRLLAVLLLVSLKQIRGSKLVKKSLQNSSLNLFRCLMSFLAF